MGTRTRDGNPIQNLNVVDDTPASVRPLRRSLDRCPRRCQRDSLGPGQNVVAEFSVDAHLAEAFGAGGQTVQTRPSR